MYHIMRRANVRDLRYRFRQIEMQLRKGEEIEVYKRREVIGRLLPAEPKGHGYPDFAALRRRIFGAKQVSKTGTDLVSKERGAY
jgi:antitoxin (DNA-binding transcriptional repressor) of toxin-antitoxin stability system